MNFGRLVFNNPNLGYRNIVNSVSCSSPGIQGPPSRGQQQFESRIQKIIPVKIQEDSFSQIMENIGQTEKIGREDCACQCNGGWTIKLRATLNATLSIQEPVTKMHPVYESGWYRIQDQFQEIQVSIQDMIDRWPGNLGDISSCQEARDR